MQRPAAATVSEERNKRRREIIPQQFRSVVVARRTIRNNLDQLAHDITGHHIFMGVPDPESS